MDIKNKKTDFNLVNEKEIEKEETKIYQRPSRKFGYKMQTKYFFKLKLVLQLQVELGFVNLE